jgi:hypothetical protein
MKPSLPLILVIAGLLLLFGAVVYDSFGRPPHVVGIISEEISARSEHHHRVASFLFWGAAATILAGLFSWVLRTALRKSSRRGV